MFPRSIVRTRSFKCYCALDRVSTVHKRSLSEELQVKYTLVQKELILKVINETPHSELSGYNITKGRLKAFEKWRTSNGVLKTITEIELIDGFSEKHAEKLFDSILEGRPKKTENVVNKIKGQVLHPLLSDAVRKNCKSILSIYVTVSSVCWTLINRATYEVTEWKYQGIDYPETKKLLIPDIFNIAWQLTSHLPSADVYVMKAEPTSVRAAGSDPNNPKLMTVNLQKAQLVATLVALINARNQDYDDSEGSTKSPVKQKVYFLRPSLPYRLYGTLIGNEKVSTDQTVEMLLQESNERCAKNSKVYISEELKTMFRSQKDLEKDMLGHCLLLALTFMDVCIYKNEEKIGKLVSKHSR